MSSSREEKTTEPPPEWLNESFFQDIYEKRSDLEEKSFKLKILENTGVVDVGENYCSMLYRVKVKCDWDEQSDLSSFIVKAAVSSNHFAKDLNFFGTEFEMYRSVIPAFEEMWKKIGEPVIFGPKYLKIVKGEPEIIVLTDLKEQGCFMMDRFEGLDEEHTLLVLNKIAKFHATSVAYKEQNGNYGPRVSRKYFQPEMATSFLDFNSQNIASLAKMAEEWKLDKQIINKILSWKSVLLDEVKYVTDPDFNPTDFQCLCHADLWLNNIMFANDDHGKSSDAVLIDFQISYWNRPNGDLFYLLASSVAPDVLVNRFDYFLRYYHDVLLESLSKLRVKQKPPTLKTFLMELLKNSFNLVLALITITPIVLLDKTEGAKMKSLISDDLESTDEWNIYRNPRTAAKIKLLLPFFYEKGMLDSDFITGQSNGQV